MRMLEVRKSYPSVLFGRNGDEDPDERETAKEEIQRKAS